MNRHGFEGFIDAFLFLTIISVASCVVYASAASLQGSRESERRDAAVKYVARSLDAILSSTLTDAFYIGIDGEEVGLGNGSTTKDYILIETHLLSGGVPITSFDSCNSRIEQMVRRLVSSAYNWSLETFLDDGEGPLPVLSLGDFRASPGYSASLSYSVGGDWMNVTLTLWWA